MFAHADVRTRGCFSHNLLSQPLFLPSASRLSALCRYHAHQVQPRFPFGHGLSYTSFAYSAMSIRQPPPPLCGDADVFDFCVEFNVTNTGTRDGADVPQLYVTYPAAAEEPPRQLRYFSKAQPRLDSFNSL